MVTATYTVRDAVTQALRDAGRLDWANSAPAEDAGYAMTILNRMLKGWQATESLDWTVTEMTIAAAAQAAQSMSPARAVAVRSVRWRNTSGTDLPMLEMNRADYDDLPNKAATGTPTQYYWDRQGETSTLYVWPIPASVTTETFRVTYERELVDIASLNDTLDVPSEWWDATVLQLAKRLNPRDAALAAQAETAFGVALAGQNYGSVYFVGDGYRY